MITDYLLEALSGRQMDILNVSYDNKFPGCKVGTAKYIAETFSIFRGKNEQLIKGLSNHIVCELRILKDSWDRCQTLL